MRAISIRATAFLGLCVFSCDLSASAYAMTSSESASVTSFSAAPTSIFVGGSSQLTAVFRNGTGLIMPGKIAIASGSPIRVAPTATTTYTLTVTGKNVRTVTKSITVTVTAPPPTTSGPSIATGDSRKIVEPTYPAVCQTLEAKFSTAQRSSPPSAALDDTARIEAALKACAGTGKSVELAAFGSSNAFYSGPITVSGEGLVLDAGVTLEAQQSYVSKSQFVLVQGANSFLGGPGTIDGRGDILTGGTPRLVQTTKTNNFTLYNLTLAQAIHPNLYMEGGSGATIYGMTIQTPANRHNADGIDIDSITNVTVTQSVINAGDDGIAVKTNSGPAANITVSNSKFYGTHGLSIGSQTMHGVTNVLFTDNYVYGVDQNKIASTSANGIRVKSDPSCGGPVTQVTYRNTCMSQVKHLIVLDTAYGTCSGTAGTPIFTDIVIDGALSVNSPSDAYSTIDGVSRATPTLAYLANISLDATKQKGDQYAEVSLDNVNFTPAGPDVIVSGFSMPGSIPVCTF